MELASSALVELKDFEGTGRGVAALRDTEEGEVLLEVELKHCWTAERAREALGIDGLSEKEAILAHLMVASAGKDGGKSPSCHLQQLPTLEEMNLPNFWASEDLDELEGSEVQTHALRLQEELPEDFSQLCKKLKSSTFELAETLSFASYQWAWSIYSSRVMSLSVSEGSPIFAIVPGLDMFNHSPWVPPGLFKLDCERNMVVMRAGVRLAAGEQVFINYAQPMFNSQMLQSFGFVLEEEEEALQSSQITLSLQVSAAKLMLQKRLLDATDGGHEMLHSPASADFEGLQELIVRHTLTLQEPLPPAFLGMVRAQHLQGDALHPSASASCLQGLQGPQAKEEMRALLLVSLLLQGKLSELRGGDLEDRRVLQSGSLSGARRLALLQRCGERRVLLAARAEAERLQLRCLQQALDRSTDCREKCEHCPDCQKAQTPWLHRLQAASGRLQAEVSSVASLSKSLFDRLEARHLIQACHLINLWVVGISPPAVPLETVQKLCIAPETWPSSWTSPTPEAKTQPKVWEEESLEYLQIYVQKLQLWGSWLLAQWMHAEAVLLEELSAMGSEQVSLRQKYAWSLPTEQALEALQRRAPLLEVGAGKGYWASLLRERSVDILAFDSAPDPRFNPEGPEAVLEETSKSTRYCEVLEGGVEVVQEHQAGRTLVLMWPDWLGLGTYGLECLKAYEGKELILVGEWRTSTFGSYAPSISQHGQSFSLEFQKKVESDFCLVERIELPRWPLFLDCLQIFRRVQALMNLRSSLTGRRGPVWRRGRITTQERTFEEIANYLLSGENDYASFQEICKNFDPPADPQQIRAVIERYPDRFTVSRDTVTVVDAHRKEAITCMIKKLVVRDMAHVEIDPNKACEHIWQAAHYALKATPCRVAQILGSVAKATLTYPDEVGKGVYPANMPLALACLIDRMVYLARQRGSQLLEKALSPKLYDILLRRWVVGRIKGSQFLANMILLWERLGYFEAKDLDKCKESLYILIAYARHDGVPDPPDKDSGDGWYKIAARDAGEQKNTEPICSQDQLQALERERQEEEDRERQTLDEEFQKRRQRTMHAMAQMGLGEEEKPDVPTAVPESPKEARDVPVEAVSAMFDALDEEELFGSALPYNSAVYSDEEEAIFGSPVGEDTPSEMPPSPPKASGTETEAGKEAAQSDTVEPQPLPEREVAGPAGPSPSPEQSATEEQRSKEAMDLGATQREPRNVAEGSSRCHGMYTQEPRVVLCFVSELHCMLRPYSSQAIPYRRYQWFPEQLRAKCLPLWCRWCCACIHCCIQCILYGCRARAVTPCRLRKPTRKTCNRTGPSLQWHIS
ncbi:LSMT-L [Symbiodinium necroappetens]|uniref:LSMT-L protein n=1 Tax=Symbiodinium necroappetens TaxID=1628268 RepID=A0A812T6Y3_9DINO|nr:LSMT-L [Symbiodinium necroappetens]